MGDVVGAQEPTIAFQVEPNDGDGDGDGDGWHSLPVTLGASPEAGSSGDG